jgi:hypothetical protein
MSAQTVELTPDATLGAAATSPPTSTTMTANTARYSTNVCPRSPSPRTARSCARTSQPSGGSDDPRSHGIPSAIHRSRHAA